MIQLASRIALTRCDAISAVRPASASRSDRRISASVCVSTADSASSSSTMLGRRASARASAARCFCPPDRLIPRSPSSVSYPPGNALIVSVELRDLGRPRSAVALVARAIHEIAADGVAEQEALLRHVADLSPQRRERRASRIGTPSIRISPSCGSKKRGIEIHQRALAARRRADHAERRARGRGEADVAQHPARLVVPAPTG